MQAKLGAPIVSSVARACGLGSCGLLAALRRSVLLPDLRFDAFSQIGSELGKFGRPAFACYGSPDIEGGVAVFVPLPDTMEGGLKKAEREQFGTKATNNG